LSHTEIFLQLALLIIDFKSTKVEKSEVVFKQGNELFF